MSNKKSELPELEEVKYYNEVWTEEIYKHKNTTGYEMRSRIMRTNEICTQLYCGNSANSAVPRI